MEKWEKLKEYIEEELEKPLNSDDIPNSILEGILDKMKELEANG